LIHAIKYDGKRQAATIIGERYGQKIKESAYYNNIDFIIPVPMHPSKERVRGYNQAEVFALGLSVGLEKTVMTKALRKTRQTISQTKKNRFARLENVNEVFKLGKEAKQLKNKHVLLVDDVLTTGSTIEACATELLAIEGIKISIATIAIAGN
jgi:ComF family protein